MTRDELKAARWDRKKPGLRAARKAKTLNRKRRERVEMEHVRMSMGWKH
jgi:hypothetical protein